MTHHDDLEWEPAHVRRSERIKASEISELQGGKEPSRANPSLGLQVLGSELVINDEEGRRLRLRMWTERLETIGFTEAIP